MYTGTPILRQKCEACNAHKSFVLIRSIESGNGTSTVVVVAVVVVVVVVVVAVAVVVVAKICSALPNPVGWQKIARMLESSTTLGYEKRLPAAGGFVYCR